ncbi:hypothetical protein LIER_09543 [Lithospermum erythrorhizon]|uniref:PB1-like domain-containing protein n=1 Tax=Lithospermum erythrorhizon TaxID=34254 RepID=A0AAV3PIZ8_LITER
MAGFIRESNHEGHSDANYMDLYKKEKNLFSIRVYYHGLFVANPSLSYEGGKVELFDCCDADTFELGPIESWAFRLGLRYGEFEACVYQDSKVEGHNGIRCLKYSKNVVNDSEVDGEDEKLNPEDVLYGKDRDGFDDGDIPGEQPILSSIFLENIDEEFVVPDHDGHSKAEGEVHSDDSDSDDVADPSGGKRKNGPQMSIFEKRRRLSGWVESVESYSDSVLGDRHKMSDFDSGDSVGYQ